MRDARAHTDKDVKFDVEPTRLQSRGRPIDTSAQAGDREAARPSGPGFPTLGSRLPKESESEVESPRVEAVPHVVERGENFWTISRLLLRLGRYYRALWKANAQSSRRSRNSTSVM